MRKNGELTRRGLLGANCGGVAAAMTGTLLAACGATQQEGKPATSKAPVTMALAAGGWVTDVDKEIHRKVWKTFQETRPHVTLDINEIAFTTDKLLTAVAGGQPPDTAYIHPNDLP